MPASSLDQRKAAGLAGSMQFTYRNPARSTEPDRALAGVASLVVGARRYDRDVLGPPAGVGVPARVARYAAGDHYGDLRRGLDVVAERLVADGWSARVVLDDNALVDRAAAHRAALGWFGKNANILVPGLGSWVVLGSVLTDAPLPPAEKVVADGCGACRRCLDGCPTGAIVEPGVVDARRCLAWLVQAEGVFPVEHRVALGDRLYGCDDCQEVCPPSRRNGPPAGPDGGGPRRGRELGGCPRRARRPTTTACWRASVAGTSPVASPATCAATRSWCWATSASAPIRPCGERADALADADGLVRAHAVWAARRLGAATSGHGRADRSSTSTIRACAPSSSGPCGAGAR